MSLKQFRLASLTMMAGLLLSLPACVDPAGLGEQVLPDTDGYSGHFTSRYDIPVKTVRDDSVVTSNQGTHLLGSMADDLFGTSFAGVTFQLELPTPSLHLGDALTLDSVVLELQLNGVYGRQLAQHHLRVRELDESLVTGKEYYEYEQFSHKAGPLAVKSGVVPNAIDSISTDYGKVGPQLRIRLSNAFGTRLLSYSGTAVYENNASFQQAIKGLTIEPDTQMGFSQSMMFLSMISANSKVRLYYKNSTDTTFRDFPINATSVITNQFRHNYAGTPVQAALSGAASDSVGFVQGMAGVALRLTLPDLSDLGDDVVIHAATLEIYQGLDTTGSIYAAPARLLPRVKADSGIQATTDEALGLVVTNYELDGKISSTTLGGQSRNLFKINLASHLHLLRQGLIDETDLLIRVHPVGEVPNRIITTASTNITEQSRIRLNLTYAKLR